MDTPNESFDIITRIASFPLSSKEFYLGSSPTSNKKILETLNIAPTLYSSCRSTL
jgi:hypothetical protein